MAAPYDVAARLAEGRPVVDDVTEYVAACRQLGYQHVDMTGHAAQVGEWYGAQDGLDLGALDADAGTLRAAATTADEVARGQEAAVAVLRTGWTGAGASAALDFLTRQQRAAIAVVGAVRGAADALTALRDDLWHAVDAQVAATLDVGAASDGRRGDWLAAARTVTTGAGDRAAASELIDLELKPFVDNVIGARWVPAMRTATDAVEAAYRAALTRLGSYGAVAFEVPFDFGPAERPPVSASAVAGPAVPAAVAPMAAVAPTVPPTAPVAVTAAPEPPAAAPPPPAETATAPAATPSMPSLPSLPTLGDSGGLGSTGGSLADLLGGLGGLDGLDDTSAFEPDDPDVEPDDPDDVDPEEEDANADDEEDKDADGEEAVGTEAAGTEEPAPEPEPDPAPTPPPTAEPLAAPPPPLPEEAAPAERTPCEIASDELPQVGE